MLDLDRFKAVNDSLGHAIGNSLLKAVGERLRRMVRDLDIVARLGGDEFAIIQIADTNQRDQVTVLANRVLAALTEPYDIDGRKIVIGTSIGISMAPKDADNADALVRHADLALYKAKSEGRNRYRFFETAMEAEARDRRELEEDMRRALLRDEFELHYQTVIDVGRRECCGAEALVRWRHPERGLLFPDAVHRPGGGKRPDHAARRLDPAARLFRRREVAVASQDRGQSLGRAAQAERTSWR